MENAHSLVVESGVPETLRASVFRWAYLDPTLTAEVVKMLWREMQRSSIPEEWRSDLFREAVDARIQRVMLEELIDEGADMVIRQMRDPRQ